MAILFWWYDSDMNMMMIVGEWACMYIAALTKESQKSKLKRKEDYKKHGLHMAMEERVEWLGYWLDFVCCVVWEKKRWKEKH